MSNRKNYERNKRYKKVCTSKRDKKSPKRDARRPKSKEDDKYSVTKMKLSAKTEAIHEKFFDLDQMQEYLCCLVQKYPDRIDVKCIGQSAQGRPILMAHVTESSNSEEQKNIAMIEAGSNGSDFYAISSALCLIDCLIKNPNYNATMDYIIIPCSNPDGYLYCLNDQGNGKVPLDLTHNFPVTHLGFSDLSRIQTSEFLNKIKLWKENYRYVVFFLELVKNNYICGTLYIGTAK